MNKRSWSGWLKNSVFLLLAGTVLAEEPNSIKSVEVRSDSVERQEVTLVMQRPVKVPASFVVNTPPRLAFDFVNTANETGKSSFPVAGANLKSVNLAESGGRTRVVLGLVKPASYETRVEGNRIVLSLSAADGQIAGNASTQFSSAQNKNRESIRDVDFRRGKAGEGRVSIDLSSPSVGIDIRQQGKNLVLEFAKTSLPRQFERRMDVADFGTPVQNIDSYAQGETVKMVIEPKGTWEYSAYQTDNRFVVEVKSVDEQAKKLAQLDKPAYKGEKLSLNFQNVEVRTVLQVIAEFTGKNIITSDTVVGNVTLRLKDVPWDQALDLILQSKGLDKRDNGNVTWVAPREEIASREKLVLEAKAQVADIEPLRSESFQLNYLKAEDIRAMLTTDKQSFLSKRGSAIVEARNNVLLVSDIPSKLDEIRALLLRADVASRQVMIEARVVIANDDFSRDLGVRLNVRGDRTLGSKNRVMFGHTLEDGISMANSNDISGTINGNAVNLPSAAASSGKFSMTLLNRSVGALLGLELSALEASGNGRTVSSPRIVTGDQQKATIKQGSRFYVTKESANVTTLEEKEAILQLDVTPRITPDGRVFMELKILKDALAAKSTNAAPLVDTRSIETKVLVNNGDTAVIGGIFELEEIDKGAQIPFLGDIPILGNLFKNKSKSSTKKELLIFITPRILDDALTLR
ncbi:type IV pilus secretin family protein [Chitinimonas sp. BJB300]|uniref:type IV pilus secretin family protein n=1 Tax=Chitinimonas sp. BJB300 TaxID=1559339 RepID=UPI000C0E63C0|nr:type IV pilus secretin family protein [Chitinimonas sp. BJB300]PHV11986.1 secretin [Chitinimonas sp. BJB300]TSJ91429.1 type IV pilus secretin PilQ [Chitinimonas sp. BJB300]